MKLKRKVFSALFTLILVLSSSLLIFAPAMADNPPWWDDPDPPIVIVILSGFPIWGGQAVTGQGWDIGDVIDLYINGEYVATAVAAGNSEGNASPLFDVSSWGVIEAGDEVRLVRPSDGLTKEVVVTSFTSFVNVEDDKVCGTATPEANMFASVPFGAPPSYVQLDTANENGYWSANFASTYDNQYDTYGATGQYDEEHDITAVIWQATETPKPAAFATLSQTYGGLKEAAEALQFDSVKELQEFIKAYFTGE